MQITRLFDIPYFQLEKYPIEKAIGGKTQGVLSKYSSKELVDTINKVSRGLWKMGVRPGDKIALISYNNRPEWNIMDLGMMQIGAVNVPVYPTISPREYVYIFNDAEVKYCFVGYGDLLQKVNTARKDVPTLQEVFTFDETTEAPFWETIFGDEGQDMVDKIKDSILPEDLATIIYTSGTTGDPKGVMLTHDNICSNVRAVFDLMPCQSGDSVLSFLPLCHIFERTAFYAYLSKGVSVQYAQSVDTLRDDLLEFKPHFFTTVPRLLEKVYERIYNTGVAASPIKKRIFKWAVGLTEKYELGQSRSSLSWKIADKLVFSKIRERVGGNIKGILTGAAACPYRIAQFFNACGIQVREAYGLTETSPGICSNRWEPEKAMLGTAGLVFEGMVVKIDEDPNYPAGEGEILIKGPNVMKGYYNKPQQTAEVFDAEGWFHTGDVGKFVTNKAGLKFLKITDRKKELLKTSNGKYIAPSPIENRFKEEFLIEQMMVLGDGQKFAAALIVPSFEALDHFCKELGIVAGSRAELLKNPRILEEYQAICDKLNPHFGHVEQIKKFVLVTDVWDVQTGELTPTMKLKRRVILEKYKAEIERIYA